MTIAAALLLTISIAPEGLSGVLKSSTFLELTLRLIEMLDRHWPVSLNPS
jgi:hypothetical protein